MCYIGILGGLLVSLVDNTSGLGLESGVFLHKKSLAPRLYPHLQKSTQPRLTERRFASHRSRATIFPLSGRATPTTAPPPNSEPNSQQNTRFNAFIRIKIYAYFQECSAGIQTHVQKITDICTVQLTKENANRMSWALLAELQAILAICLRCVGQLKSCRRSPIPSSIPGTPKSPPSVHDVGLVIFQLLFQIKTCFQQMNQACSKHDIIRITCQDSLVQISSAISNCLSISGANISGVLSVVTQMSGGNPAAFLGLNRWGLNSIIGILS